MKMSFPSTAWERGLQQNITYMKVTFPSATWERKLKSKKFVIRNS